MWLMADTETVIKELENLEGEEIGCRSMEMLCLNLSLGDFCWRVFQFSAALSHRWEFKMKHSGDFNILLQNANTKTKIAFTLQTVSLAALLDSTSVFSITSRSKKKV